MIRNNLITTTALFVTSVFNFYLLNFYMKYVAGDFYVNAIVQSVATVVSIVLVQPF